MPPTRRKTISTEDKNRLYQCHMRGEGYYVLAEQLGIMRATAYNIIRRCMENNGVVAKLHMAESI